MDETIDDGWLTSVLFWILFTFVSAFVMLSLFVGAVTLAMSESMDGGNEHGPFKTCSMPPSAGSE